MTDKPLTDREVEDARRNKKKVQVFTPPEIIDFIENSVDHILKTEFGVAGGLNGEHIHIIDPFAGEANFTTRGMDTGIITPETAARIEHMEILPESCDIAREELGRRGVGNPVIRNVDTLAHHPGEEGC